MNSIASEISVLRKWNHRLLPKESSRRFNEFVLMEDPNKPSKAIKNEWFIKQLNSVNSFLCESASMINIYEVQTFVGRELLTYYIKDDDVCEFESDMMSVWPFIEEKCYNNSWWFKEYGHERPMRSLVLLKKKFIINLEVAFTSIGAHS